mmetsp:Transcript_24239/g.57778  ORF Transcript_24239/g.57778 Transcript_24239/m.57778 type:complete len:274 (-) Transcript_24239:369-1190(-)
MQKLLRTLVVVLVRRAVEADDEQSRVDEREHAPVVAVLFEHAAVPRPRVTVLHRQTPDPHLVDGHRVDGVDDVLDLPLQLLQGQHRLAVLGHNVKAEEAVGAHQHNVARVREEAQGIAPGLGDARGAEQPPNRRQAPLVRLDAAHEELLLPPERRDNELREAPRLRCLPHVVVVVAKRVPHVDMHWPRRAQLEVHVVPVLLDVAVGVPRPRARLDQLLLQLRALVPPKLLDFDCVRLQHGRLKKWPEALEVAVEGVVEVGDGQGRKLLEVVKV